MAIDGYNICPCGNGKKIKFCKCSDSLHEMNTVLEMINGDQSVAALDRIDTLIERLPSDAWLLAIKCELLLKLGEGEALEETSAKFIRLRPDNPLASMFRSVVAIARGSVEESANLILNSLANSGEDIHPMFVNSVFNLIQALMQRGMTLSAMLYAEMLTDTIDDAAGIGNELQSRMMSDASVSVLVRDTTPSPDDYEGKDWSERFREAEALLHHRYQVSQARSKLESLQREFGDQYAILVGLFQCRLLQADQKGAATLCRKLLGIESISLAQKAYWQAIAWELDSDDATLKTTDKTVSYEIEDPQAFEEKLQSMENLSDVNDELIAQYVMSVSGDEIPPKSIYTVLFPWEYENASDLGGTASSDWVAFYGRQTDRPARLIVNESQNETRTGLTRRFLEDCSIDLSKGQTISEFGAPLQSAISLVVVSDKNRTEDEHKQLQELVATYTKEQICDQKFEFAENKTLREAAKDEKLHPQVLAILLCLEASGLPHLDHGDFSDLTKELGLTLPSFSAEADVFDIVGAASYFWTDLETIDQNSLLQLSQSAISRNVVSMYGSYLAKAEAFDWDDDTKLSAEFTIQTMKLRQASNPELAEKIMLNMYDTASQLGIAVGNLVLQRVELLNSMNRLEDAQQFLHQALEEHPKDPVMVRFMEMMMVQMQQGVQQQIQSAQDAAGGGNVGASLMKHAKSPRTSPKMFEADSTQSKPASESSDSGSGLWIPGQ